MFWVLFSCEFSFFLVFVVVVVDVVVVVVVVVYIFLCRSPSCFQKQKNPNLQRIFEFWVSKFQTFKPLFVLFSGVCGCCCVCVDFFGCFFLVTHFKTYFLRTCCWQLLLLLFFITHTAAVSYYYFYYYFFYTHTQHTTTTTTTQSTARFFL